MKQKDASDPGIVYLASIQRVFYKRSHSFELLHVVDKPRRLIDLTLCGSSIGKLRQQKIARMWHFVDALHVMVFQIRHYQLTATRQETFWCSFPSKYRQCNLFYHRGYSRMNI